MNLFNSYIVTNHARERFVERSNKKFKDYKKLFHKNSVKYKQIEKKIHQEIKQNLYKINEEIRKRLKRSKNEKSYKNCTGFMDWYYTKYGYVEPDFLVDEDILFIVISERGKKLIVTCLDAKTHFAGKAAQRKKFSNVKKKKDKIEELFLQWVK
jgi:hypothetical protein